MELHILDPDFYDELYTRTAKRNKDPLHSTAFGSPDVAFATVDHDLHRVRRAALNPFFFKKNVRELEPVIKSKVDLLCQRFERLAHTVETFVLVNAFACLTTDVITEYAWGQSYDYFTRADWAPDWYGLFVKGMKPFIL